MAETADAQKVRARTELDKLHKGLVIGIESKSGKQAFADQTSGGFNSVDVPSAIDMVREALGTLEALEELAARQQVELEGADKDNTRLRSELGAAQKRISDLQSQIAVVKLESQAMQNSLSVLEDERQKLQERQGRTEDDLKTLVGVIVSSFRDSKKKDVTRN